MWTKCCRSLKSDIIAVKFDWWEVVAKIMSREIKKNVNYISKNSAIFFHTSIKLERVWDDVKSFFLQKVRLENTKKSDTFCFEKKKYFMLCNGPAFWIICVLFLHKFVFCCFFFFLWSKLYYPEVANHIMRFGSCYLPTFFSRQKHRLAKTEEHLRWCIDSSVPNHCRFLINILIFYSCAFS